MNCLVASRDSKRIVTASEDGTVIVWNTEHGTPEREWFAAEHQGPVRALALSPDGKRLVTSGVAGGWSGVPVLVVWDIGDEKDGPGVRKVATMEGHTGFSRCVWSSDGAFIAATCAGAVGPTARVRVWDAQTFQEREPLKCSPHSVTGPQYLQFSPNSRYLAWISHSPVKCCVSRPHTPDEEPVVFFLHPDRSWRDTGTVNGFSFDPESRRIATVHGRLGDLENIGPLEELVIRIWDIATGTLLIVLGPSAHAWPIGDISFSHDGRSLLSRSLHDSVQIWDVVSGELKAELEESRDPHRYRGSLYACFSPDGKYVAVGSGIDGGHRNGSERGLVSLWRTRDASCVVEFIEHRSWVFHVAFSPNGEFLASADKHGVVHIRQISKFIGD